MKKKDDWEKYIDECLEYCQQQNGMNYCKNCGLDEKLYILVKLAIAEAKE